MADVSSEMRKRKEQGNALSDQEKTCVRVADCKRWDVDVSEEHFRCGRELVDVSEGHLTCGREPSRRFGRTFDMK
jgi:hypothetical protein